MTSYDVKNNQEETFIPISIVFLPISCCSFVCTVYDNLSTGEVYRSLFDIINSDAMCLAEFI